MLVAVLLTVESARLLRVPRIYNALITSDEMLIPSQAYPAVAPVLRPAFFVAAPAYPIYNFTYGTDLSEDISEPRLPEQSLYTQRVATISDHIKNNRPSNPDIPDVLPPPLPISRLTSSPSRTPEDYPPQPSPQL